MQAKHTKATTVLQDTESKHGTHKRLGLKGKRAEGSDPDLSNPGG
jgi:hypothetical protein